MVINAYFRSLLIIPLKKWDLEWLLHITQQSALWRAPVSSIAFRKSLTLDRIFQGRARIGEDNSLQINFRKIGTQIHASILSRRPLRSYLCSKWMSGTAQSGTIASVILDRYHDGRHTYFLHCLDEIVHSSRVLPEKHPCSHCILKIRLRSRSGLLSLLAVNVKDNTGSFSIMRW